MEQQITQLRQTCYNELRKISQLRTILSKEAAIKLVCSFVTSRLDYCNSLFSNLPDEKINRLQQIQNHAARLVTKTRKREHVTPILKELHWLPVKHRIDYKIATITYLCLKDPDYPKYLTDLINEYVPFRSLRSTYKHQLVLPRTKLKTYGDRAFTYYSPYLWNNLGLFKLLESSSVDSFKRNIKTHLFNRAFDL